MQTISSWWMWAVFFVFIGVMLLVDLFMLGGKRAHRVSSREALSWTAVWVILALGFNLLFWYYLRETDGLIIAKRKALEFFTGYLIEKSLSVDNVFVFYMIFTYFQIPAIYQRRVLSYGVIGAIVMRLIMILLGTWLITQFQWILYVFGLFLIFTGIKMFYMGDKPVNLADNSLLRWLRQHCRITTNIANENFFVRQNKLLYLTPLFLALIFIEISDLVFALDSIPAIFAITTDPFIVFTSNIFAILGLRSLYFLLANMAERFYLLKYGLALILLIVGGKMILAHWVHLPIALTLGLVAIILVLSMVLSLVCTKNGAQKR